MVESDFPWNVVELDTSAQIENGGADGLFCFSISPDKFIDPTGSVQAGGSSVSSVAYEVLAEVPCRYLPLRLFINQERKRA